MKDKIKLLEAATKRIEDDRSFIAFYLAKYIQFEETNKEEVAKLLTCSIEDYYRLGLCGAPDVNAKEYPARITAISDYINIPVMELSKIIKRVNSVLQFPETDAEADRYLMAARDKKKDK